MITPAGNSVPAKNSPGANGRPKSARTGSQAGETTMMTTRWTCDHIPYIHSPSLRSKLRLKI
jgi:hypothetical protein